jgi:DNA mismatch repair protein MutL
VAQIHGPSFLEKCLPIESAGPVALIQGYVGVPETARPGTQHQTLVVNQRWVSAPWFSAAVRQGFGDLLAPNRHPFALILLTCDPSRVDVNVHPTKREVRFFDESALFGELTRAVRNQTNLLIPEWNLDPQDRGSGRIWEGARGGFSPDGTGPRRPVLPAQEVLEALYGGLRARSAADGVREGDEEAGRAGTTEDARGTDPARGGALEEVPGAGTTREDEEGGAGARSESAAPPPDSPAGGLVPLWQLHQRYLFAQTRQGMLIIDQHAAHERILYERALQHLRGSPAPIQQLLFPLVLALETEEWEAWREVAEDSINLGIDADEFGAQTVLLRGVPMLWDRDPEGRFRELLRELSSRRTRGLERLERLAAAFACRSAVRSGQTLTLEEMNALVDQLFATGQPHGDPHGRPTFIQVSLADLDRRFGRSR